MFDYQQCCLADRFARIFCKRSISRQAFILSRSAVPTCSSYIMNPDRESLAAEKERFKSGRQNIEPLKKEKSNSRCQLDLLAACGRHHRIGVVPANKHANRHSCGRHATAARMSQISSPAPARRHSGRTALINSQCIILGLAFIRGLTELVMSYMMSIPGSKWLLSGDDREEGPSATAVWGGGGSRRSRDRWGYRMDSPSQNFGQKGNRTVRERKVGKHEYTQRLGQTP